MKQQPDRVSRSPGAIGKAQTGTASATIFDLGAPGRAAAAQQPSPAALDDLPAACRRTVPPELPEVSELQVVRHYTNLSVRNFAIDNRFYPLGSCTMKYNPRGAHRAASLPVFSPATRWRQRA